MRVPELRPRASYDVESIVTYVSFVLGAPRAEEDWYSDFKEELSLLSDQTELGCELSDERLVLSVRRTYLVGKYRVFYSYDAEALTVWRVLHVAQVIDDYAMVDLCD